jgi:hypothetical protein
VNPARALPGLSGGEATQRATDRFGPHFHQT